MAEVKERAPNSTSVAQANKIADFLDQLLARGFNVELARKLTVEFMRNTMY
jgi:hypothetical protein